MGKRTFGYMEAVFDIAYLCTALYLGGCILLGGETVQNLLFGIMALVLVCGDACHLIPRIMLILQGEKQGTEQLLGLGKMLTSIGMTIFYLILWYIGVLFFLPDGAGVYTTMAGSLGALRILLCLLPQNKWMAKDAPQTWNLYRNIPFVLLGSMVGILFYYNRNFADGRFYWMWLAIFLSFAFYLPVVFGAKKHPMLGMLMLPKSCVYIWIIAMGL